MYSGLDLCLVGLYSGSVQHQRKWDMQFTRPLHYSSDLPILALKGDCCGTVIIEMVIKIHPLLNVLT